MLPIRLDSIRDINTLQNEIDDVLRRVFGTTDRAQSGTDMTIAPAINTFIKDDVFHLEAELPGVDTDKLDLRVDGHDLTIRGERRNATENIDKNYMVRETQFNSFERRLSLPDGVDVEMIHANYKDGLLEVTMPMAEVEKGGRKIEIEGLSAGKKRKEVH